MRRLIHAEDKLIGIGSGDMPSRKSYTAAGIEEERWRAMIVPDLNRQVEGIAVVLRDRFPEFDAGMFFHERRPSLIHIDLITADSARVCIYCFYAYAGKRYTLSEKSIKTPKRGRRVWRMKPCSQHRHPP
jgi:hypothetical protein